MTYSSKYDVYGAVRGAAGAATTAQGFVGGLGHLSEAATGLIYMRARYYDPNTGRFVSQDQDYHGGNWFVYCNDDPVNRTDATGRADGIVTVGVVNWITSVLIAADVDFEGVGALVGTATENAIAWVEWKIEEIKAMIAAEGEVAGLEGVRHLQ